jgi:hypothetical protein
MRDRIEGQFKIVPKLANIFNHHYIQMFHLISDQSKVHADWYERNKESGRGENEEEEESGEHPQGCQEISNNDGGE